MTPSFPTTTQNPCETTICAECLEGETEDPGVPIESKYIIGCLVIDSNYYFIFTMITD